MRGSADYETDVVLADGDEIRAGGRTLRVVHRPGHSTTDTLFVDEASSEAFVGDHLLAEITSGAEATQSEQPAGGRRRALLDYLDGLRLTAAMGLETCFTGHGPVIRDPARLIEERLAFHSARLDRIAELVDERRGDGVRGRPQSCGRTRSPRPRRCSRSGRCSGHLDLLVERGTLAEDVDARGRHSFHPSEAIEIAAARS